MDYKAILAQHLPTFAVMGQVIKTFDLPDNELKFNITDQPSGVYFVKINFGNQSQVIRITKE